MYIVSNRHKASWFSLATYASIKRTHKCKHNDISTWKQTTSTHAQARAQAKTLAWIIIFPFSCAWVHACVCAATNKNEISLRHNTISRIFTGHDDVSPVKTLNSLESSDDLLPLVLAKTRLKGYRMVPFNLEVLANLALVRIARKSWMSDRLLMLMAKF